MSATTKQPPDGLVEEVSILVVEDDQAHLDLLAEVLVKSGFNVVPARSSNEACALLANENFSVVLLDWQLTNHRRDDGEDSTGSSILKKCREISPHLPVVVMSGVMTVDVRHDAILNEADSFLQKPFSMDLLTRHISRWVDRSQAESKLLSPSGEDDILPLAEMERVYTLRAVELLGKNISRAAERLKIHRHTVSSIIASRPSPLRRNAATDLKRSTKEKRR